VKITPLPPPSEKQNNGWFSSDRGKKHRPPATLLIPYCMPSSAHPFLSLATPTGPPSMAALEPAAPAAQWLTRIRQIAGAPHNVILRRAREQESSAASSPRDHPLARTRAELQHRQRTARPPSGAHAGRTPAPSAHRAATLRHGLDGVLDLNRTGETQENLIPLESFIFVLPIFYSTILD
jgi:hypothetical protein